MATMTRSEAPGRAAFPTGLGGRLSWAFYAVVFAVAVAGAPVALGAQIASGVSGSGAAAPRVFLDCVEEVPCSQNHFRTEIAWVNWMNDREDANVHVLVTRDGTAGEGSRYAFDFIGVDAFEAFSDRITYTAAPTNVELETLEGLTQALRLGLVRFAVESGLGTDFALAFTPRDGFEVPLEEVGASELTEGAGAVHDPWDFWTFRVGLSGNASIQESRSSNRINPSFGADRVTEAWKFNFSASANLNREKIELSNRTVRNDRDNWNSSLLLVRSLGPNFSTGAEVGAQNSIQNNQKARITVTPGIEWNYYPYVEASRRQLIAHYAAGVQYNDYREETLFGVERETVPLHKLGIQYRAVESWGNAGVSADASQYLHGSGLYSYGASGNLSLRVVRGLELSFSASAERIADQIYMPAGNLSEEDILLGRQSLPTGFSYQGSIGFTYRWGSGFANIVNTRFPSVSGGGPGGGGGGGFGGGGGGGGRGG